MKHLTPGRKVGRERLLMSLLGVVLLMTASCLGSESEVFVTCQPSSNSRLNIIVRAPDDYGFVAPCETNLEFYIWQNTSLRSLDAVIELSTPDGDILTIEQVSVNLEPTDHGMVEAQLGIGTTANQNCRSLTANLDIQHCRGGGGERIECPAIRVRPLLMFADFSVSGENLDICYDE